MKTEILSKNPGYFAKSFRADLKKAEEADEQVINSVAAWLGELADLDDFADIDNWIPASQKTRMSIDDLQDLLGPIMWMVNTCREESAQVEDLIDDLKETGILEDTESGHNLEKTILSLAHAARRLLEEADARTGPSLPLLYISRIRTRCIAVSEFDKGFNVDEDDPKTYKPTLKRIHPRLTLELEFKDKAREPVGILLTPKTLRDLKKWLDLAEVELRATEDAVSSREEVVKENA
jgi:hypothetical protein